MIAAIPDGDRFGGGFADSGEAMTLQEMSAPEIGLQVVPATIASERQAERFGVVMALVPFLADLRDLAGAPDDAGLVEAHELRLRCRRLEARIEQIAQGLHRFDFQESEGL